MDNGLLILGGAFLLIAAALGPKKNRDTISRIFGFNVGAQQAETDTTTMYNEASYQSDFAFGYAPQSKRKSKPSINVKSLPTTRRLTEKEMRVLAAYVADNYGFKTSANALVTTAYVESSFQPWALRHERRKDGSIWATSYGLMQTLLATAVDMYNKGYTQLGVPTADSLKKPLTSMYFGAAYIDWLKRGWPGKSNDWYVRAYNGGPGWETTSNGPKNTKHYLGKWAAASQRFSVQISFGG